MQKNILKLILIFFLFVASSIKAQTSYTPVAKGFISRLIEIKYTSELYLSSQIKKGKSDELKGDSTLAIYNTIRWKVDALVYQISSEMITQNSPAAMRRLDAWSYGQDAHGSIKKFVLAIGEIEQLYKAAVVPIIYPNSGEARSLNLTTNVFYLLKDSYSIVKGLSDLKTRKVMALVELLDHARLMGPGEVVKMGK